MEKMILRKKKFPFNTPNAAQAYASQRLQLEEGKFTIVPHEGGYAIKTEIEVRQEILDADAAADRPMTTSWKPASYIDIPKHLRKPGYRYRACNTEKAGNIDKKRAEGWEVDTEITKAMKRPPTIQDGVALDTNYRVRELVIMRMPEDVAKQRDKYFADLTNRARDSVKSKFQREASELNDGAGAYGESKESFEAFAH